MNFRKTLIVLGLCSLWLLPAATASRFNFALATEIAQATREDEVGRVISGLEEINRLRRQGSDDALREAIATAEDTLAFIENASTLDEVSRLDGRFELLVQIGLSYVALSQPTEALTYYQNALPLARTLSGLLDDRSYEARVLSNLADAQQAVGDRAAAIETFLEAITIQQQLEYRESETVGLLYRVGLLYSQVGNQPGALNYLQQALTLNQSSQSTSKREVEAAVLLGLGSTYDELGDRTTALDYFEQALSIQSDLQDLVGKASTLNNIANIYMRRGDSSDALETYQEAIRIHQAAGNSYGEATVLNNIGQLYSLLGRSEDAITYYEQSLEINQDISNTVEVVTNLHNLGQTYTQLEDLELALSYYQRALRLNQPLSNPKAQVNLLQAIGAVHLQKEQVSQAIDYFEQAITVNQALSNRDLESDLLHNLGTAYRELGDQKAAQDYYQQSLKLTREIGDRTSEVGTLGNLAFSYEAEGDLNAALTSVSAAIDLIEDLRTNINVGELRTSYFATVQRYYQLKSDLLMRLNQSEAAFETSEAARARLLVEILSEANVDIRKDVDPELSEKEASLREQIQAVEANQVRLRSQSFDSKATATLDQQSDRLLQQLDQVLSEIRRDSPAYANLTQPQPLTLAQIQQEVLDSETVLLQYALGENSSYLWVVSNSQFQAYELPSSTKIEPVAERFLSAIATDTSTAKVNEKGQELTALILPQLPEWTADKRLVIAADGALSQLPFNALPLPDSDTYTPLLTKHQILTQPSISTVAAIRQQHSARPVPANPSIALLADPVYQVDAARADTTQPEATQLPTDIQQNLRNLDLSAVAQLPYTRVEAEQILETAAHLKTTLAQGYEANYSWVTDSALSEYSILHLATHGFVNSVNPQLSGIVLSLFTPEGKPAENGFLRLHDIFNLKLAAELVVLSACQTGLGENIGGEGIIGLSRGFIYAGARRVMVSLWNVNDESTAHLMGAFYEQMILQQQSPAEALRAAQEAQWKAGAAPYRWAAFTLQGDW